MARQILIDTASVDDAQTFAKAQVEGWQEGYKDIFPSSFLKQMKFESRRERWEEILANEMQGEKAAFVAKVDGKGCGFATIGPARSPLLDMDAEIWALYVMPDYWGQGIGAELIKACRTEIQKCGGANMFVSCLKDNDRGIRFYKKMGANARPDLPKSFVTDFGTYDELILTWDDLSSLSS